MTAREWFNAQELAEISAQRGIATFPATKSGVIRYAREKGWDGSSLCRKRAARGGGLEYHFTLMPEALRWALEGHVMKVATLQRHSDATEIDLRRAAAIKASGLPAAARIVMEARAVILTSIEGYAIANGENRAWGIARFLEAQEDAARRQEIERLRDAGAILTEREIATIGRRLVLTTTDGFQLSAETLRRANDRRDASSVSRRSIYAWFKARDEGGIVALSPTPPKTAQAIPAAFGQFLRFYAKPTKPSITDAYRAYADDAAARADFQPMTLTLNQVEYILSKRLNNVEKMVGREGLLTLRSRMAYVTRTTEDMWPTTIYTADGKTFDAEIADPVTKLPIRPEITTVLDVVTRKIVGLSLARSENQRSVAEALRNACVSHGIPAIFYVDRGPGYRNEAMDADVSGLMGRLGITKMHAAPYGSQAKGRIERPNATVWDTLAKRLPTYIGADMDKEAGQKIHKLTRSELKQFGQCRALPSWEEFVRLCEAMVAEYNDRIDHGGLPKFDDPETGRQRRMSPNEAWAAHVANGFEAVPVDPAEADDLFRPYEIRTARRAQVQWNTNLFFHPALEAYHEEKVMVGYDYHQADRVWVREFDLESGQPGKLICVARFGGNSERYVPLSYEQKALETRAAARLKRVDRKRDAIEAERDALLMIEQERLTPASFVDITPAPEPEPAPINVVEGPAPVRRRTFASDEELAAWALAHPAELTPNQLAVLKDCMSRPAARELFRMSGIDLEALRTLLRAAA